MKYYLLTPEHYELHSHETDQYVAWSFDGSKCIIECEDSCDIQDATMTFNSANECNEWRYDTVTEEWRNWISEEDFLGE